jgi:hypothetical protein
MYGDARESEAWRESRGWRNDGTHESVRACDAAAAASVSSHKMAAEEQKEQRERVQERDRLREQQCRCGRCGECVAGVDLLHKEQRESLSIAKSPIARNVERFQLALEAQLAASNYKYRTRPAVETTGRGMAQ